MRLNECLGLRVKNVDFERRQINVRDGRGSKDRVTLLPSRAFDPLRAHLEHAKQLHQRDLAAGLDEVSLPFSLARKYPRAAFERGWGVCVSFQECMQGPLHRAPNTPSRSRKDAAARGSGLHKKRESASL